MALSFWRALNPTSKNSGITNYCNPRKNPELIDYTVTENINRHRNVDSLTATFHVLLGQHYLTHIMPGDAAVAHHYLKSAITVNDGVAIFAAKGVLDYLIFPLVARKLINDSFLPEREKSFYTNLLAWMVAIPLELVRFSAATVLTLFLAPIVALVRFIQSSCMENDLEEMPSGGMKA